VKYGVFIIAVSTVAAIVALENDNTKVSNKKIFSHRSKFGPQFTN